MGAGLLLDHCPCEPDTSQIESDEFQLYQNQWIQFQFTSAAMLANPALPSSEPAQTPHPYLKNIFPFHFILSSSFDYISSIANSDLLAIADLLVHPNLMEVIKFKFQIDSNPPQQCLPTLPSPELHACDSLLLFLRHQQLDPPHQTYSPSLSKHFFLNC